MLNLGPGRRLNFFIGFEISFISVPFLSNGLVGGRVVHLRTDKHDEHHT